MNCILISTDYACSASCLWGPLFNGCIDFSLFLGNTGCPGLSWAHIGLIHTALSQAYDGGVSWTRP